MGDGVPGVILREGEGRCDKGRSQSWPERCSAEPSEDPRKILRTCLSVSTTVNRIFAFWKIGITSASQIWRHRLTPLKGLTKTSRLRGLESTGRFQG